MRRTAPARWAAVVIAAAFAATTAWGQAADTAYLAWTRNEARDLVGGLRRTDMVGNRMSFRGLKTDRAINYKMRATWLTPDVIRATARSIQLEERLPNAEVQRLVAEAEGAADTVFFVELDPQEGSGVIPLDWIAILQPRGLAVGQEGAVRGTLSPRLRELRALGGLFARDYAYDHFWVAFTFTPADREILFGPRTTDIELVVNIRGQEGVVSWPVPASVRQRLGSR